MSRVFDPIRRESFPATPEEIVRQELIHHLVNELNFPQDLMIVERKLSELVHLDPSIKLKVPQRRIDLLCFAKNTSGLFPLMLVECKAVPLKEAMKRQVIGYNYYVKARYIALVSKTQTFFGIRTKEGYEWIKHIPSFNDLL